MKEENQTPPAEDPALAAMRAECVEVDAQNGHTPPGELAAPAAPVEAAHVVDRMAEAGFILKICRPLLGMMVPALKDAPDTEWQELQQPIADLLEDYGVNMPELLKNPWARLGASAIPLGLRVVNAWSEEAEKSKQHQPLDTPPEQIAEANEAAASPLIAQVG